MGSCSDKPATDATAQGPFWALQPELYPPESAV